MFRLRVNADKKFEDIIRTIDDNVEQVFLLNTHLGMLRFKEDKSFYGGKMDMYIDFSDGRQYEPHHITGGINFVVSRDGIKEAFVEAKDSGKSGAGYDGEEWYFDINFDTGKTLTYQEFMKELAKAAKKLDNAVSRFRNRTSSRFSALRRYRAYEIVDNNAFFFIDGHYVLNHSLATPITDSSLRKAKYIVVEGSIYSADAAQNPPIGRLFSSEKAAIKFYESLSNKDKVTVYERSGGDWYELRGIITTRDGYFKVRNKIQTNISKYSED